MKLSNLVQSKNSFDKIDFLPIDTALTKVQKDLELSIVNLDESFLSMSNEIAQDLNQLKIQLTTIDNKIKLLGRGLSQEIETVSAPYCIEGNVVNKIPNVKDVDIENIRTNRHLWFTDETNNEIITSIRKYTNPKYAALEFGCGDGYWTKYMVAADPLYIVDFNLEFLESASSQFPGLYKNRIRKYLFGQNGLDRDGFEILPQKQFGYILTVNNFDFLTLDRIHTILRYFFDLLRPGGVALFTYNNCEESANVRFVECGFKGYATKTGLEDFCKSLDFEILNSVSLPETSLIEIKKPGELKSVKTHQALGEIVNRNN